MASGDVFIDIGAKLLQNAQSYGRLEANKVISAFQNDLILRQKQERESTSDISTFADTFKSYAEERSSDIQKKASFLSQSYLSEGLDNVINSAYTNDLAWTTNELSKEATSNFLTTIDNAGSSVRFGADPEELIKGLENLSEVTIKRADREKVNRATRQQLYDEHIGYLISEGDFDEAISFVKDKGGDIKNPSNALTRIDASRKRQPVAQQIAVKELSRTANLILSGDFVTEEQFNILGEHAEESGQQQAIQDLRELQDFVKILNNMSDADLGQLDENAPDPETKSAISQFQARRAAQMQSDPYTYALKTGLIPLDSAVIDWNEIAKGNKTAMSSRLNAYNVIQNITPGIPLLTQTELTGLREIRLAGTPIANTEIMLSIASAMQGDVLPLIESLSTSDNAIAAALQYATSTGQASTLSKVLEAEQLTASDKMKFKLTKAEKDTVAFKTTKKTRGLEVHPYLVKTLNDVGEALSVYGLAHKGVNNEDAFLGRQKFSIKSNNRLKYNGLAPVGVEGATFARFLKGITVDDVKAISGQIPSSFLSGEFQEITTEDIISSGKFLALDNEYYTIELYPRAGSKAAVYNENGELFRIRFEPGQVR